LVILALIALVYYPIFNNLLTNWDDRIYILDNPYIKTISFENIKNIFTCYYTGNYHPFTLISLAIDFKLSGIHPWAYQLTNLLLHLGNTILVFCLLNSLLRLNNSDANNFKIIPIIAAALFGLHTLNVESVAWVSERKNVLYTFFFLVSLIIYIRYIKSLSIKSFILSIVLFLFSLLSKGMALPLSICIIGIDYYARRNLLSKRVICEKIPFLALSISFGIIAIMAQQSLGAIQTEINYSWLSHFAVAGYGFVQYLLKLCFPFHLSAFYPYPVNSGSLFPFEYYVCLALVILGLIAILWFFKMNKTLMFGILLFTANISIVLQLLPVGDAMMADRYVYVASIGFFFIVGYCVNLLWNKRKIWRKGIVIALFVYCIILSIKTFQRVGVWKNSFTLWNDVLMNYPENNARGYLNRGALYFEMGKHTEATKDFERLLTLNPGNSTALKGLGLMKLESAIQKHSMQDTKGAMVDYDAALSFYKSYDGYYNRGVLKMNMNDFAGALADFDNAIKLDSLIPDAFINKGFIDYQKGNFIQALANYNRALNLSSNDHRAYLGRGLTKIKMGNKPGGCEDLKQSAVLGNSEAATELQKIAD
jgi:Tfp pilus assembly protein PilF